MTTVALSTIDLALARASFLDFLDWVYVPDETASARDAVPFVKWPHIMRLHEAVEDVRPGGVLPFLKARQIGATSYFEARFLWLGQFFPSTFLPVISQGEKEAMEVIAECKFMYDHLPSHLQVPLITQNTTTLSFAGGGRIQAFPSTSKAGQSFTGTEILFDEADFHVNFLSSYHTLLPLIQETSGKMFLVSTANPEEVDSGFRQLYQKSENRQFLGYYERPGRTEEGYQLARSQVLDEAMFEKHNARTEAEALAPPRTSAYFDPDVLAWMLEQRASAPMSVEEMLSIWKPPVVGLRYVLGGDTAWGRAGSYNAAVIIEWETGEQVAELHGRLHPNDMAYEVVELHKRYNHAYMGLERAGEGQERDGDSVVVVDKVLELLRTCSCSGRLFYHDHLHSQPSTPGWQTDGRTRPVMLGEFREAIRNLQVTIRSREGLQEMLSFIRAEDGRPEAGRGAYDDRVMAYAIAWQMRKYANFSIPRGGRQAAPVSPF